MINQHDLIEMILIKTSKSGRVKAYNERLREIWSMLNKYTFTQDELQLIKKEIWNNLPKWRRRRINKDAEGSK